jgi:hypothetical protein
MKSAIPVYRQARAYNREGVDMKSFVLLPVTVPILLFFSVPAKADDVFLCSVDVGPREIQWRGTYYDGRLSRRF